MSKVYEALQRARAEGAIDRRDSDLAIEIRKPEIVDTSGMPPLQMEREMGRLYQRVLGLLPNSESRVIQFVGSRKNEGTSTILREFGQYLGQNANKSVLLVDGDLQHMSQHKAFKHPSGISLQDVIREEGALGNAISQVRNSRLFICRLFGGSTPTAGPFSPVNDGMLWTRLRNEFDFILIDSPPISDSDDGLALCSITDGVILVIEAEKTRSQVVSAIKNRIIQHGGNILGLVFNKQRYYIPKLIYKWL
jgi:protein-tyrosine kinase